MKIPVTVIVIIILSVLFAVYIAISIAVYFGYDSALQKAKGIEVDLQTARDEAVKKEAIIKTQNDLLTRAKGAVTYKDYIKLMKDLDAWNPQ